MLLNWSTEQGQQGQQFDQKEKKKKENVQVHLCFKITDKGIW